MSSRAVLEAAAPSAERDDSLVLEPAARHRLNVARVAAQVVETLVEKDAWEDLHPAVASHVRDHARHLSDWVGGLRATPAVRAHAAEAGSLKRLQARLDEAIAGTAPGAGEARRARIAAEATRPTAAALFQGDFSKIEIEVEGARPSVSRKAARRRAAAKVVRVASNVARRISIYVAVCFVLVAVSLAFKTFTGGPIVQISEEKPRPPFEQDPYLEDLRIFLPVVTTFMQDGMLQAVVADEWKLETDTRRRDGAAGAHVFLSNRNVPRLLVRLEDGTVVAAYNRGNVTWYGLRGEGATAAPADLVPEGAVASP